MEKKTKTNRQIFDKMINTLTLNKYSISPKFIGGMKQWRLYKMMISLPDSIVFFLLIEKFAVCFMNIYIDANKFVAKTRSRRNSAC